MKDQMLKIAKVKSEKEFYKKYPTEEAFMKAHKKEFKKAAMGSKMVNDQLHQLTDFGNPPIAQDGATTPKFEFTKPESFGGGAAAAGMTALQNLDKIAGGISAIGNQKKAIKKADQSAQLAGLALTATQGVQPQKNKYVRPEDALVQPGQLGDPYGSGTNYLAAQNGTMIGGNTTEIQNTYTPTGDLYQDLEYEPLTNQNLKQYEKGGRMPKAEFGEYFQDSGQAQIGGAAGEAIGTVLGGPLGGMAGKLIGQVGGNLLGGAKDARKLKKYQDETAMNTQQAAWQNQLQSGQFSKSMEHGGYMNPEYNPQVIAKFGDYNVKDLLKPPYDADMLRSGGHLKNYTAPSEQAMSTERPDFAMGGQLKTTWGGYAEPISQNPYLPGSGETVMFRGKSHEESDGNGHTGIGVKYGKGAQDSYTDYAEYGTEQADADVEVESGEPATELMDKATGETSMIVYGDMKIPSYGVSELKDPKAKGKKFKNYANDLSKIEKRQSSILEKAINRLDDINPTTSFEKLEFESLSKTIEGANMQLKGLAAQKELLAGIQNAILDTSKEFGLKSAELATGKIKQDKDSEMAKFGGKFMQAQVGKKVIDIPLMRDQYGNPIYNQPIYMSSLPEVVVTGKKASSKKDAAKKDAAKKEEKSGRTKLEPFVSTDDPRKLRSAADMDVVPKITAKVPDYAKYRKAPELEEKKDEFGIEDALRQLQPYLIPSNQEPFNASQISPEIMALATNQLEPVQAQTFRPLLETPYTVSYQDVLNANQADYNALQRQVGYNPAALSQLSSQKYAANAAVKAQEFRENQGLAMGAYNRNRGILNDASLKNLAILDQQYQRQSQAKSNTKAQAQAALSSIADKIAKHKLENRTLGVYENMYNYRFGPKGRAINVNAPYEFNLDMASLNSDELETARKYRELQEKKGVKKEKDAKNGSIVKAIKNL